MRKIRLQIVYLILKANGSYVEYRLIDLQRWEFEVQFIVQRNGVDNSSLHSTISSIS